MKVINPKKEKTTPEITTAQKCANEVNDLMGKYSCRFSIQTLIDDGQIHNQVLIKEIKDGDNIIKN